MADLTPERLTDLRALAVAATPGPWFFDGYCRVSSSQKAQRYDSIEFPDCEVPAWKTSCGEPRGSCHGCPFFDLEYEVGPVVAYVEPHHGDTAVRHHAADAEFLGAVSPDVVVGMLDEIERLRVPWHVRDEQGRTWRLVGTAGVASPGKEFSLVVPEDNDTESEPVTIVSGDMTVEPPGPPDRVRDLMAELEQSVAAAKAARVRRSQPSERTEG